MRLHACAVVITVIAMNVGYVWGQGVVFPTAARVVNVTQPPYNARGDGKTDDTAAFQRAFTEEPVNALIYVPDGTYLIRDTISWGRGQKRQILQGQSREGTIIRLADSTPGFGDAANPKPMIWTGKAPAQRFRNGIRDITIDSGRGNPGAIPVQFIANNQGGIQNVTIRSGDVNQTGPIGLDLGYTGEQGPCLIKNVTIEGFDVGVFMKHAVDSITFEHLTLIGQRRVGLLNEGQVVNIRGLVSRNSVPAIRNAAGASTLTLLDAELIGGDSSASAIENHANLFARNVRSEGYGRTILNTQGHGQSVDGSVVEEFASHEVLRLSDRVLPRSLNLPVVETPDVPWDPIEQWVNVEDFGPPEPITLRVAPPSTVNPLVEPDVNPNRGQDGRMEKAENWAPVLQRAIDSGATTIYFPHRPANQVYGFFGPVHIRGNVRRIIGCEASLGHLVESNRERSRYDDPSLIPVLIVEDGSAPVVVIERFNTWYTAPRIEHRADRTLVIKSLSIYDLETFPGAGDTFLEDVRAKRITVNGTRLWARQLNTEGIEEPRNLVNGGTMWVLGLKTENDTTIAQVQNGGQLEVCGGFFYSNKDFVDDSFMFINRGGRLSATFGESVLPRVKRPFDILQEWHDGKPLVLPHGKGHRRGGGSMASLLVSQVPWPQAVSSTEER